MPQLLKPRSKVARTYPAAAKALRAEVERVAAAQIEPEVERRAQERAEGMYRSRSFAAVRADDGARASDAPGGPEAAADVPQGRRTRVPRGLQQADLDRPWDRERGGSIFRPRG